MKPGDIVLAALPQADGRRKLRPALLLCRLPGFADWLACGISTQLQHRVEGFDDVLSEADVDFKPSGLHRASAIRLGFLGTLPESDVAGSLGSVAPDRLERLRRRLADHLLIPRAG